MSLIAVGKPRTEKRIAFLILTHFDIERRSEGRELVVNAQGRKQESKALRFYYFLSRLARFYEVLSQLSCYFVS